MKQLSVEATNVLNKMVGMMEDFCVRIDNSEGDYMPVYVSLFNKSLGKRVISVGHFMSVDGQILCDPQMMFIYDETEGVYFPSYYRQDCLGVEQNSIKIVHGEIKSVNKFLQAEHTDFANQWLRNIKDQQNL